MKIKSILKRVVQDIRTYCIAILLFIGFNIVVRTVFHAFCPFLIITGFPCAGCGMTRAVFCFLTGQFERGMNLNPAAPFWIVWIFLFVIDRYAYGKNSKWIKVLLGIIVSITMVIYLYRMLTQFPSYKNNILAKYGTFLKELLQNKE